MRDQGEAVATGNTCPTAKNVGTRGMTALNSTRNISSNAWTALIPKACRIKRVLYSSDIALELSSGRSLL